MESFRSDECERIGTERRLNSASLETIRADLQLVCTADSLS